MTATALLSVFDKSGITELAAGLHELGWRLVSSGGTAAAVASALGASAPFLTGW